MRQPTQQRNRVSDLLVIWAAPLLAPGLILLAWSAGPEAFSIWVSSDTSVYEHAVAFVLLLSLLMGIYILLTRDLKPYPGLRPWLIAWCLGVGYFLGEDMNWGQHLFGWQAEGFFASNKEAETNLHNMNPWFNQKPRMLVQAWVLVVGFLVALATTRHREVCARAALARSSHDVAGAGRVDHPASRVGRPRRGGPRPGRHPDPLQRSAGVLLRVVLPALRHRPVRPTSAGQTRACNSCPHARRVTASRGCPARR